MVPAPDGDVDAESGPGPTTGLFGTQLLLLLVALVIAAIAAAGSIPADEAVLTRGLVLLTIVTVVVAVVPVEGRPRLLLLVPVADVVVITVLRSSCPTGGFGILMLIPVVWLALVGGRRGAVAATVAATAALWCEVLLEQGDVVSLSVAPPSVAGTASLHVAIVFVAAVVASAVARDRAHRRLVRRQAQSLDLSFRAARRDERVLNTVMDSVPFVIIWLTSDGELGGANRAARAMLRHLGLNPSLRPEQHPLYHLDGVTPVAPDDLPHRRGLRGEPIDGEAYWLGHASGVRVALEVSARLVLDDHGAVDRLVVVARDIGDLVAADEARDQAVTSISHEFRTPLSSILGFLELAADTPDLPPEAAQHLVVAERNASRLLTLVNDLLDVRGRAPRTAMPVRLDSVDLTAVVTESLTAMRPLAHDRIITMLTDLPPSVIVDGDGFRLRQVVDNLVTNAIKYNVDGGTVVTELTTSGRTATLTVTDSGPGLTDRELTEVFEPYLRSAAAATSTVRGSGMGLAICRDIIELHGGTITLRHADGGGTTVVVTLPTTQEGHP